MNLAGNKGKIDAVDLQLKQVVLANHRFQGLVHNLTDICWETCIDKPSSRLEPKTQNCITNCVERFIDTSNFIANRWQSVATNQGSTNWE